MLIVSRLWSSLKKLVWFTWWDGYFRVPNFLTHVSIPKHVTYNIYYQKKRKPAICHFKEWALHGGMDFFQVPNSHSCLLVDVACYAHVYDILHIVPYTGIYTSCLIYLDILSRRWHWFLLTIAVHGHLTMFLLKSFIALKIFWLMWGRGNARAYTCISIPKKTLSLSSSQHHHDPKDMLSPNKVLVSIHKLCFFFWWNVTLTLAFNFTYCYRLIVRSVCS
jgi:hypothetical protein